MHVTITVIKCHSADTIHKASVKYLFTHQTDLVYIEFN